MTETHLAICLVCREKVSREEAFMFRRDALWYVAHEESCRVPEMGGDIPPLVFQLGERAGDALTILDSFDTLREGVIYATSELRCLSAYDFGSPEAWRCRVLVSRSVRWMDRLEVEAMLDLYLPMELSDHA